jgi:serine/threonine-protein kinase
MLAALSVGLPARSAEPTKQQCVAANDAAQDLRQSGKLRQAREKLVLCSAASCPAIVRDDCVQRLTEVDAAMPSIVFEAKDAAGNDLAAVTVTMDGQPFADKLDGAPRQLDPGEHRFVFNAQGLPPIEKVVVVREGDKTRHERVVLGAPVVQAPAKEEPVAPATPAPAGSTQRMVGLALGGAGVVGVLVGSVFGLVSKSTYNHALGSECGNSPNACSMQGAQDGQTAHGQATVSTVGFVAGFALLVGGAALYFTAPHGLSVGPTVGGDGAGLQVRGAW